MITSPERAKLFLVPAPTLHRTGGDRVAVGLGGSIARRRAASATALVRRLSSRASSASSPSSGRPRTTTASNSVCTMTYLPCGAIVSSGVNLLASAPGRGHPEDTEPPGSGDERPAFLDALARGGAPATGWSQTDLAEALRRLAETLPKDLGVGRV